MATYKIIDAEKLDADLKSIADKLRDKSGTTEEIEFPLGFENTIDNITTNSGENKLAQVFSKTITELTEEDFGTATYIPDNFFQDCTRLTSVIIPNKITSIGKAVFNHCSSIETILVNENNPIYHSYENCIIATEAKKLITGCKNSIIPSDGSVIYIGDSAFDGCKDLKSLIIPRGVMHIGYAAF